MNTEEVRPLAKEFLLPLISRAEIDPGVFPSTTQEARVARIDPCTIAFKVEQADHQRLRLRRSQPFANDNEGVITEKDVVSAFVAVIHDIKDGLTKSYRTDLLASLERRIVCKAVSDAAFEPTLLATLDQFSAWASRLYEGHPITSAIGFLPDDTTQSVKIEDAWLHDFSAVITNGHDTLLTANRSGNVLGQESLAFPATVPSFVPYRLAPVAHWAQNGRMVVVLNRTGEILLLAGKRLVFARRSGSWHFLTPEAAITQMGRPDDLDVRRAILETALDVSFARSGGCIGVVIASHQNEWKQVVVKADDHLSPPTSVKARVLTKVIAGRKFHELDRRLRQELVAIDGATVINHHGDILAVGAILKIEGGSTGCGRLAAAKALSKLGLGIKISQDGGIRFHQDEGEAPKIAMM